MKKILTACELGIFCAPSAVFTVCTTSALLSAAFVNSRPNSRERDAESYVMLGTPGPPLVDGRTSRSDFLTWFSFVLFAFYSEFSRLPHFDSRRLESRLTEEYWRTLSV